MRIVRACPSYESVASSDTRPLSAWFGSSTTATVALLLVLIGCKSTGNDPTLESTTSSVASLTRVTNGPAVVAAPVGLRVDSISGNDVGLVWQRVPGATRYIVLLFGSEMAQVTEPMFLFGSEAGGRYQVSVVAVDAQGNRSEESAVVEFHAPEETS